MTRSSQSLGIENKTKILSSSSPTLTPRSTSTRFRSWAGVAPKTPPSTSQPYPELWTWPTRPSCPPQTSWSSSSRLTRPSRRKVSGHPGELRLNHVEETSLPRPHHKWSPVPITQRTTPAAWNVFTRSLPARDRSSPLRSRTWTWNRKRISFWSVMVICPTPRCWPRWPERPNRILNLLPQPETSCTSTPRPIRLTPDVATGSSITKVCFGCLSQFYSHGFAAKVRIIYLCGYDDSWTNTLCRGFIVLILQMFLIKTSVKIRASLID